jgi:hypothetical protein
MAPLLEVHKHLRTNQTKKPAKEQEFEQSNQTSSSGHQTIKEETNRSRQEVPIKVSSITKHDPVRDRYDQKAEAKLELKERSRNQ